MAYDIHIAKTLAIAEVSSPSLQLDEALHEAIFSKGHLGSQDAALLLRLSDYYRDAHFAHSELPKLCSELDRVVERVGEAKVRRFALQLRGICEQAKAQGADIYAFAD